jgi:uncharacterized membrane protein
VSGRPGAPDLLDVAQPPADSGPGDDSDVVAAPRRVTDRALAWWLIVGGLMGLVAAATLLVEKIKLLADPTYVPSCSLNPVLSCGSIMSTDQAEVLGFPNPVIGVAAFPLLVATGAAVLAGGRLARWYWWGLQAGVVAGAAFVVWLFVQSLYRIGALCPYCMVVWAVVVPTFIYVTLRNLESGLFGERVARAPVVRGVASWHAVVVLVVFLLAIVLIGEQFWYYWSTLL